MVLAALALYRLHLTPTIGNLSHIDRIVDNMLHARRGEERVLTVSSRLLLVAVRVQPCSDAVHAAFLGNVLVKDKADDLGFLLVDFQDAVATFFDTVAERVLCPVP